MIFNTFPREFGMQRMVVYDMDKFLKSINSSNGKVNCFTTVHAFDRIKEDGKPDYETAVIDKIFFDFDSDNCVNDGLKLHEMLMKDDLKHSLLWSGGGVHAYIFTEISNILHKKSAIKNVQLHYTEFNGDSLDLDEKVVGDICRLTRIPNTWNPKRRRYCIPVTIEDLQKGREHLLEISKVQEFKFTTYGNTLLNLSKFDIERNDASNDFQNYSLPDTSNIDDDLIDKVPNCIKFLLMKSDCDYKERFSIIIFMRDALNYTYGETVQVLKQYLSPKKFHHCVYEECKGSGGQPGYLYKRQDLLFPLCSWFKSRGYCFNEKQCPFAGGIYI